MSNSINNIFDDFVEEEKEVVEEEKAKSINVFDIVNSIYYDRSFILSEETKKYYTKYMINKSLSMGQDTIHFSNEMNRFPNLTNEMHLGFLNGVVRKRKRFNKWAKSEKIEHIDVVKFFLKCKNTRSKSGKTKDTTAKGVLAKKTQPNQPM